MPNVTPLNVVSDDRFFDLRRADLNLTEQNSVINLAIEILEARNARGQTISSPRDSHGLLRLKLCEVKHEVFGVLFLDNKHRIICDEILFKGTIDGASVYPRTVAQRALEVNSAALILYHNHPSGVPEPSEADYQITRKLSQALELIDVRVLDHIVVANEGTVSMAERGQL